MTAEKKPRKPLRPEDLPLFPSEEQIAVLVIGEARAKEWPRIAKALEEADGFPPIDEHVGARYWPAVAGYFRNRWNVDLYNSNARVRIAPAPLRPRPKK
ncbi:hypothetical protein QA633_23900 [Bradyrhizobium barranii]|uniref:hypothetical protein n=1 Tax=Bradyrhizobium barranii TaxID=2992140 RepID=UPI0024AF20E0|nr:hypothetical protein [Bradyrhizobium barranii]WFT91410.1 hypothetical protein QA633_23900 [Bradyrhizobium barranii]